jgi:hypothetical protein
MWAQGFSPTIQSLVMIPIVLYQAEQILCGQIAVFLFRRWARDEWMPRDELASDEETVADSAEHTADDERGKSDATLPNTHDDAKREAEV